MQKIKKIIHTVWYEFCRSILRLIFFPLFRISATGRKNVPRKGPVLLLSNHQSFFDPMFCQLPINRHMHYVTRSTLYDVKIFGPLMSTLNTIPIRRGEADIAAMKKIIEVLKKDQMVCLYPEGTRSSDGKIADIKPGFGLLSRRGNATIVPVTIDGAYECWPRHSKKPKIGKVYVTYGKSFSPQEIKELGADEFAKVLTARLRKMQNEMRIKHGKEQYEY